MSHRTLFTIGLYIFVRIGVVAALLEGSQVNILYLKSESIDNPSFREAVSNITGGETYYFNASRGSGTIPTVEFMNSYGCVMVHTRGLFEERGLLGDRLAEYVDNGGTLVFGDGFTGGGFTTDTGVGGAIMGEDYSPIGIVGSANELSGGNDYVGDGITLLYEMVTVFESTINNVDGDISLQGGGIQDGSYGDGTLAAAYRPDFRVVYLHGAYCWGFEFPTVNCPGDDHPRRWANACSVAFVKAGSSTTTEAPATTTVTTEAPATSTITTEAPATTTEAPATTTDAPTKKKSKKVSKSSKKDTSADDTNKKQKKKGKINKNNRL